MKSTQPHTSRLDDTACIEVAGPDAELFLRSQLTANPPLDGRSRLAGWLDARGRVQALFRLVGYDKGWLLLTARESAARICSKLGLYILRRNVTLTQRDDLAIAAFAGDGHGAYEALSDVLNSPNAVAHQDSITWLRIGPELVVAVGPLEKVDHLLTINAQPTQPDIATQPNSLTQKPGDPEGDSRIFAAPPVALAEIRLGLPWIDENLAGRYVAQMLNLDLLGAIEFDKGCYPGQEVVARIKYRGQVKRRMQRFLCRSAKQVLVAGRSIITADGNTAGEVVRAATGEQGIELLAVIRLDAAQPLTLADEPSAVLERYPLPYETSAP